MVDAWLNAHAELDPPPGHSMPESETNDGWSIGDALLGLLFLVTGCLLTTLVVLLVRRGQSGIIVLVVGLGGFLIGPILILIGGNAIVHSLRTAGHRLRRAAPRGDRRHEEASRSNDGVPDHPRFGATLEERAPRGRESDG